MISPDQIRHKLVITDIKNNKLINTEQQIIFHDYILFLKNLDKKENNEKMLLQYCTYYNSDIIIIVSGN